ncbi:MAG: PqqD family protein [Dethiobacter sp.]|nr:PqqD family protein [Dethiobacter sp.]MCL5982415.1 PqqD family protein [Bacillota bacterium]
MEFAKHVKVRQEKFGAVMFETLCEKVFVTNETGAEILRLLEEGREPIYIIAELAQNYSGDPEMIKDDVNDFMSILKATGIIK